MIMYTAAIQSTYSATAHSHSARLSGSEIDTLLDRLARGHLSTFQEEYADLKQALAGF